MWFNQAKCDIYMGTGAGTKLLKEIGNAQKSIKISSPYLSPKMVYELIRLHKRGVSVSLITSDYLEGNRRQEKSVEPLIVQEKKLNEEANKVRNRWVKLEKALRLGSYGLLIILLASLFVNRNWLLLYGLTVPLFLFLISRNLNRRIHSKKIYSYSYRSLFPFKVFVTPDSNRINDMFIHGKIYIIDGHTAYLGSLNFTESGTKYNYETRIRVTESMAVQKIDAEFDKLYHNPEMAFFGIEEWGKAMHNEQIN